MPTATMTSKGQLTVPREVRAALGLSTGDKVSFVKTKSGAYELVPITGSVKDLEGIIPRPAKPLSIEDMQKAIAKAASGK